MNHEQLQSTQKGRSPSKSSGFSLVEVILATSVFALLVTALLGAYLYGQESTALAGNRARAVLLAEEGLEAARNIRDANFTNLTDGTHGLAISANQWALSGSSDASGMFTRQVVISTIDTKRKQVSSQVSWQQNPQRSGTVTAVTRMTNWQADAPPAASCNDHAVELGFSAGTCRANTVQCAHNGEVPLLTGNSFCTDGPSTDTCCALPL